MKKVMVRAWNLARLAVKKFGGKAKDYFSQALTKAWKEWKMATEVITVKVAEVAAWIVGKNLDIYIPRGAICATGVVTKETEKAVFVTLVENKSRGHFEIMGSSWFPKSQCKIQDIKGTGMGTEVDGLNINKVTCIRAVKMERI